MLLPTSRHFRNLSVVIFFKMLKFCSIMACDKVDSNTFPTPTTRTTYTMKIGMFTLRNIKVNDNTNHIGQPLALRLRRFSRFAPGAPFQSLRSKQSCFAPYSCKIDDFQKNRCTDILS